MNVLYIFSRSATICAAYLIQEMGMNAESAVETIRNGEELPCKPSNLI